LEKGFSSSKEGLGSYTYTDDTITVQVYKEKVSIRSDGKTYNTIVSVAEIIIQSPSQLRAAVASTANSGSTAPIESMGRALNAIVAINGDYYGNRTGTYELRQGRVLRGDISPKLDILIIDYDANFHIYTGSESKAGIEEMKGNTYQCLTFGPALVVDGELSSSLENLGYGFGAHAVNPRTAIGQLGPLHYIMVVAEGRNNNSCGFTCKELARFMLDKGCVQAFNLDGGATSIMTFNNKQVNGSTRDGKRNMYDILYFASAIQ